MVRVKICGITSLKDAEAAVNFGADAVGFVFAKSKRQVSVSCAKRISRAVGPWVATVGVFVNENPRRIREIAEECSLSVIQLHGDEPGSVIRSFSGLKVVKAFRVGDGFDTRSVKKFDANAYLFDTKSDSGYGGTGVPFDWKLLARHHFAKPVIISGGLDPINVAKAVKFFLPYGVDVSSGVEMAPRKKDLKKMKDFIRNAKKV